jgi:quercetin dioxygenase-like cupin family protein
MRTILAAPHNQGVKMSSIQRELAGDVMVFRLEEQYVNMRGSMRRGSGPTSRTLLKNGPLRVTLVTLPANGEIKEHRSDGPITVQVLAGSMTFQIGENEHALATGDLLSLAPTIRHSVVSEAGVTFLLTNAHVSDD